MSLYATSALIVLTVAALATPLLGVRILARHFS